MSGAALHTAGHRPSAVEVARIAELIKGDKLAEARTRLDVLLAEASADPALLALARTVESRSGNHQLAVRYAKECLSAELSPAAYRRDLDAFLEVAGAASDQAAVDDVLDRGIPLDDAGQTLAPGDAETLFSLANRLIAWRRTREGLALVDKFGLQFRQSAKGLSLSGIVKAHEKRYEEALGDLHAAGKLEPPSPLALLAGQVAAIATDDQALTRLTSAELLNRFPIYVTKNEPTQRATIGVVNWFVPKYYPRVPPVQSFYFAGDLSLQLLRKHHAEYRFVAIFANSPNAGAAINRMPKPDVILNGVSSGEEIKIDDSETRIREIANLWKMPVINDASVIVDSARLAAPKLYGDIENLVVPRIESFDQRMQKEEFVNEVESRFSYPVIVRDLLEQEGRNSYLARDRTELREVFVLVRGRPYFYVVQYIEREHDNGLYRRVRAAIAGGAIQVVRADWDSKWSVRERKSDERVQFYLDNGELLEQEAAICADPDRVLEASVMSTLQEMRQRMPLDVLGIDFDVMPDGRLLFFECNAGMDLLSAADPRVDHPKEAEGAFVQAFHDLVRRKMDG